MAGPPDIGRTEADQLRHGLITAFAAYLLWGAITLFWKRLHRFDPFEIIGWRILWSAVMMVAVLTVTRRWGGVRRVVADRRLLRSICIASVLLTINWTSYLWAVVNDHVLDAALGYFLAPLGTMAVGVLVLQERMSRALQVAVGLLVVAIGILAVSYGRVPYTALLIAASWTGYGLCKKRVPLSPVESLASETFVLAPFAAVAVAVLSGRSASVVHVATHTQWGLVALTGFATTVPLLLFATAAQRVPLTILGPMQYLVPTINFMFGWLLYHESLPPARVLGFVVVWIALAIVTVDAVRRARSAPISARPVRV